ncbi:ABC transporter substrate-binding protein [Yinghuangia sp. YIM S10712]|uniref:ABC transporter substrate-binding protein n=1 Tax=Yinghuangia sp. YIM S10712 TaxID=3436930 RepID=UPI003F5329AB
MPNVAASPTRRRILAAGAALGIGALAAACGDDKDGTNTGNSGGTGNTGAPNGGSTGGAWSFRDDRGQDVSAKSTPKRIVAFIGSAAALKDYDIDCVGVFGPTKGADGKPDVQAGDVDVSKVEILGQEWGQFSVEKYVGLRPELLVSPVYEDETLWYVPDESKDKILPLAPSVGIRVAKVSLTEPLRRNAELAASLGADLNSAKAVDAKKRFETASETLRQAAKAAGGLKVLAASAAAEQFYASAPDPSADLRYFKELGIQFVIPDKLEADGYYEILSWENAGKYAADLIMMDNRSVALQPKDLTNKPTWNELPAVKAGQVVPWVSEPRFTYAGVAPLIEELAAAIAKSRKLT